MELGHGFCLSFFLLLSLSLFAGFSSSSSISDGVFVSQSSTGRNLLQAKKACPINFEFQNYTVITSQCKGPKYPPKLCCGAFTEFACPYAEYLNDLTNDCASTMFSYINLYGKYPPGLFANECKGDKNGLPCTAQSPSPSQLSNDHSGAYINCKPSSMLVFGSRLSIDEGGAAVNPPPTMHHCRLPPPSLPPRRRLPLANVSVVLIVGAAERRTEDAVEARHLASPLTPTREKRECRLLSKSPDTTTPESMAVLARCHFLPPKLICCCC